MQKNPEKHVQMPISERTLGIFGGQFLSFRMVGKRVLEGAVDEQLGISYGESKKI